MEYINVTVLMLCTIPWILLLWFGGAIVANYSVPVGVVLSYVVIAVLPVANIVLLIVAIITYFDIRLEDKATVPKWLSK